MLREETLLRDVVQRTGNQFAEGFYCLFYRYISRSKARGISCYEERLGQISLYLTRTGYHDPVFLGKLFHTEDRDDVLKFLIALEHLLDLTGNMVML